MEQKYFIYDIDNKVWIETKDKALTGEISILSRALAGQDEDKGYVRQNLLWAVTDFSLFDISYNVKNIYAPVRWRVQASEKSQVVIIIGEYCNVVQNQSGWVYKINKRYGRENHKPLKYELMRNVNQISLRLDYKNWKYTAIPATPDKVESSGVVYNYRIDWTMPNKASYVEIPDAVVKCAMEILQGFAKDEFGFNPTVPANMEGAELLKSFVRYPLDPSVAFWVDALEYSFGMKVLHNTPTNFEAVCEALGLPPSKGLKKVYHENSKNLLLIYYLHKYLEIDDINVWQLFYDDSSMFSESLDSIGIDRQGEFYSRGATVWYRKPNSKVTSGLKSYYAWASEKWGNLTAGIHVRGAVVNWCHELGYLLEMLKRNEYQLSDETMQILYKEGISIEANDAVAREYRNEHKHYVSKVITIDDTFELKKADIMRECDARIGKFVAARSVNELVEISKKMENCVYTYSLDACDGVCTIYTLQTDDEYLACIEVRKGAIVQALGANNERLHGEILDEVKEWALKYDLELKA